MSGMIELERFDQTSAMSASLSDFTEFSDRTQGGADMAPPPIKPCKASEDGTGDDVSEEADPIAVLAAQLSTLLGEVSRQTDAARAEAAAQMANAVGEAAHIMLPALMDRSLASEIATATVQIATSAQFPELRLLLHPEDHDAVVDALRSHAPPDPVAVMSDPAVMPGNARLTWDNGGGQFDQNALLERAVQLINEHRARLPQSEEQGNND